VAVGNAINKSDHEVISIIHGWWSLGWTLLRIEQQLIKLAQVNGKKLFFVQSNNN